MKPHSQNFYPVRTSDGDEILIEKRGQRGATVRLLRQPDLRLAVEVVGSDGVTEAFLPNRPSMEAARADFDRALAEDTDEFLRSLHPEMDPE